MGLFGLFKSKPTQKQAVPEEAIHTGGKLVKERFRSTTHYHQEAIGKLAVSNPDWRKNAKTLIKEGKVNTRIPRYTYVDRPVQLVPEPTNEHDPNAIKVIVAGEHIGYVPAEIAPHIGLVLRTASVKYITVHFDGGDYKIIPESGEALKMGQHVIAEVHIGYAAP